MSENEKRSCACGLGQDLEHHAHGTGTCLVEGKWVRREVFEQPPRELVAQALKNGAALENERLAHEETRARLRDAEIEKAAHWRASERWRAAAEACARIVAGDDSAPDVAQPGRWGALTDRP